MDSKSKEFMKNFDQVETFGNWTALKRLNPKDYDATRKAFYDAKNAKDRDLMSQGAATSEHTKNPEASYGYAATHKPLAYRHRYTTDDYLRPIDGTNAAISFVLLHDELKKRGISLQPYGDAKDVKVGDRVRVALPMHMLEKRIGQVIDTRRGKEYLVEVGEYKIWLELNEMKNV
jgi:hypothetical protein